MKRYLLSIYQPDEGTPPPDVLDGVMREMATLISEMKSAGAWVFNGGLFPPTTATVVRQAPGAELLTTDGPYIEGKEHIGGFVVIQAPDLDAALTWANKLARVLIALPIEVRPFVDERV
jgi:hypothetical protein